MEVIGLINNSTYICKVNHDELEKFFNAYYGKMKKLRVGDKPNLASGYDFTQEIKEAFRTTKSFIESNKKIIETILSGITIISHIEDQESKREGHERSE